VSEQEANNDQRQRKLAMCVPTGGSNIELMCPADEKAPLWKVIQRHPMETSDSAPAGNLSAWIMRLDHG